MEQINNTDFTEQIEDEDLDEKYKFKLDNYEGPLDLLLDLIKHSKMDIMDIKLALITDQYMLYMKSLENLDMELASEFITMAATLLEIKSKYLLPQEAAEMEDEEDPEKRLLLQIQEYKILKEAGENLQLYENVNKFYKKPDDSVGKVHFVLKDMTMDLLIDAFVEIMGRVDRKAKQEEPKKIEKDRFTVAEKIASIKDALLVNKKIKFTQLFEDDQTKSELINIFLAILELMKTQMVKAVQSDIYGEIEIYASEIENGWNDNYTAI